MEWIVGEFLQGRQYVNWKDTQYFKEERVKSNAVQVKQLKWQQADWKPVKGIVVQLTQMSENVSKKVRKVKLSSDYGINQIRELEFGGYPLIVSNENYQVFIKEGREFRGKEINQAVMMAL